MKIIHTKLPEELHGLFRRSCFDSGETMQDAVVRLIEGRVGDRQASPGAGLREEEPAVQDVPESGPVGLSPQERMLEKPKWAEAEGARIAETTPPVKTDDEIAEQAWEDDPY